MRSIHDWPLNSIRFILLMCVMALTLPLIAFLFYNNFYAVQVVRNQVAESYKKSLSLYMSQIDSQLNNVDNYLSTTSDNMDLLSLSTSENEDDYYLAKIYLKNVLNKDIALYGSISGFFVYEGKRHDYMDVLNYSETSNSEANDIREYMVNFIDEHRQTGQKVKRLWQVYAIHNKHYLLDIVNAGDAYLGSWINTDRLVQQLKSLEIGNRGEILLANKLGGQITSSSVMQNERLVLQPDLYTSFRTSEGSKYLVISSNAKQAEFSLVALIPDHYILENLPYLRAVIWLIVFAAILIISLGVLLLRKVFLVPIYKILLAMKRVREGDWGIRVDLKRGIKEFNLLADSFNAMMTEVQTLRVNVFEEQLDKQREELRRLQLQINPHFFLNSLNIVYNLAKIKNYDLIMQMTMSLIQYFRYLFRSNTSFVILQNELEHTRNYLQIQYLRFPGQLTWDIYAPNYVMETPVPPLVIQTFVENSIKHAITLDEPIEIKVRIDLLDKSRLAIRISDSGIGFSNEVLINLQSGKSMENENGEHTGIWNVHRRLRLLYGDLVTVYYSNDKDTGGAVIEIILPTSPEMGEEHDLSNAVS